MTDEREHHVSEGQKIVGKLKRGTGTRDQDTIKLVARGETASETIKNFQDLLDSAHAREWDERLRKLQPDEEEEYEGD